MRLVNTIVVKKGDDITDQITETVWSRGNC